MHRGQQFPDDSVEVFRGVPGTLDTSNVGSHWSESESVAHSFRKNHEYYGLPHGTLVRGYLPASSVETDPTVLKRKGVGDTQDSESAIANEREVTAKEGAPVTIKSITTFEPKKKSRAYKSAAETIRNIPTNPDYRNEGDEEKLNAAYGTINRAIRTRTYKRGKQGTA